MTIHVDMMSLFDIITISSGVMLGLLFLTAKRKNKRGNIFLGLFLWSLTAEVFSTFAESQSLDHVVPSSGWLTLLLLFFYVVTTLNYRLQPLHTLLLLPFLFEFLDVELLAILSYLISMGLLIYMLRLIRKNEAEVGDFYSEIDNKTLAWMKVILFTFLAFHAMWIMEDVITDEGDVLRELFAIASAVLTAGVIFWIGHHGFNQPEIFHQTIASSKKSPGSPSPSKPQNLSSQPSSPTIKDDNPSQDESDLFQLLTDRIRRERLFLQKDVTIRLLARQLNINEKELSKLINLHTNKNFYHYINQFRVEEFKRLLHTPKAAQLSLLGLSEEAGFNSKSTFYAAFKSFEGMTPKQYHDRFNKSD